MLIGGEDKPANIKEFEPPGHLYFGDHIASFRQMLKEMKDKSDNEKVLAIKSMLKRTKEKKRRYYGSRSNRRPPK